MSFTLDYKYELVEKVLKRGEQRLADFAKEHGVGRSTLQKWVRLYHHGELSERSGRPHTADHNEQIKHILAVENLDDEQVGAYCRKNGLYSHDVKDWREKLMNKKEIDPAKAYREENRALKKKNKALEKDIARKEKALAEASALLILKKKVDRLFEGKKED